MNFKQIDLVFYSPNLTNINNLSVLIQREVESLDEEMADIIRTYQNDNLRLLFHLRYFFGRDEYSYNRYFLVELEEYIAAGNSQPEILIILNKHRELQRHIEFKIQTLNEQVNALERLVDFRVQKENESQLKLERERELERKRERQLELERERERVER